MFPPQNVLHHYPQKRIRLVLHAEAYILRILYQGLLRPVVALRITTTTTTTTFTKLSFPPPTGRWWR